MKQITFMILLNLILSNTVLAGASNNDLYCNSMDKKFQFSGNIPGAFAEFETTIKADGLFNGKLYSIQSEENAALEIYDASNVGVFTLKLNSKSKEDSTVANPTVIISLHGLPKSFSQTIYDAKNRVHKTKFKAEANVFIYPNAKMNSTSKVYHVVCTLEEPEI